MRQEGATVTWLLMSKCRLSVDRQPSTVSKSRCQQEQAVAGIEGTRAPSSAAAAHTVVQLTFAFLAAHAGIAVADVRG
jgi:hypothetical protein